MFTVVFGNKWVCFFQHRSSILSKGNRLMGKLGSWGKERIPWPKFDFWTLGEMLLLVLMRRTAFITKLLSCSKTTREDEQQNSGGPTGRPWNYRVGRNEQTREVINVQLGATKPPQGCQGAGADLSKVYFLSLAQYVRDFVQCSAEGLKCAVMQ